ncbi:MAG TPA: ABC transporter permease, partial [Thermoplasmata archaeon]|nr:ABC transporter permease [Thermoplasmata archaeon]
MPGLRRKLRRDVGRHRTQFAALAVMVLLGVAFFVSLYGAMANLRASIARPYEELRFADLTAAVGRAPADVVGQVERLPGVDSAIGRLNVEVPTTFPGREADVVVGRLLSLPAPARPAVNDVLVTAGEYLRGPGEALAEKNFADHHGLRVGDDVRADFSGTEVQARIVGIVVSPEYLWPARSAPEHMPDVLRRWGVLFLAEEAMAEALGFQGSINEVAAVLEEGADPAAVAEDVRDVLAPFGLRSIVPREDQPSEAVLETMVGALDALSVVFPSFFLVIVALSTYVVLTRLIHAQRPQIGILLALGFSRRAVLGHYLGFALLLGLVGSLAGLALGFVLSLPVTDLFASRVSLPVVEKTLRPDVLAVGVAMSLAATAAAGLLPAYRASREEPVQMMRSGGPRARRFKHEPITGEASRLQLVESLKP